MKIVLKPVSKELQIATEDARSHVASLLQAAYQDTHVENLGSSAWEGSLSRGDIDLLLKTSPSNFNSVVSFLRTIGSEVQKENWNETFASFTLLMRDQREVGLQLVVTGSRDDIELTSHNEAMHEPDFRKRYDIAKQHAAQLGPNGYGQVKDLYWKNINAPGPTWSEVAKPILKVLREPEWESLLRDTVSPGAPIDIKDGYIHFSTPEQVEETVAKHFSGETGLWLLTLDAEALGPALKWEPSRGGALFPHLYGPLQLKNVCLARPWALT